MIAITTFRIWRTATVRQMKEVRAPQGSSDEDVMDAAIHEPWQTVKTFDTEAYDVEEED